jgi:hypothetical protein
MLDGVLVAAGNGQVRRLAGRRRAGRQSLVTFTVPISVTNRRVDVETPFTTKAGRTHKTHRQGPVFPASASATTITTTAAAALYANPAPRSASFTSPQRLDC